MSEFLQKHVFQLIPSSKEKTPFSLFFSLLLSHRECTPATMGMHAHNNGNVRLKQWGRTIITMGIHFLNNEGELQLFPNKDTV